MLETLVETVKKLTAENKGLLAMDESNPTCNKRFATLGIPQTPEKRREYRELLVTTPQLNQYISGAILFDETVRQKTSDGKSFIKSLEAVGILPGIKVDAGTTDLANFPAEKTTEGLDGLRGRLKEYAAMGLRFAKWRAVIIIGKGIPTDTCINVNMNALAQYAALCQEAGLVPMVEPEVLMDGTHSLEQCYETTTRALHSLFVHLYHQRVSLEGMLLKPNMVLPGLAASDQSSVTEIARATVKCFLNNVPAAVGGIAFLSGGQRGDLASQRLNEMNKQFANQVPWPITFSFSRALQYPAIEIWKGKVENKEYAQQALLTRAKCNSAARSGSYTAGMEPTNK